MSEVDYIQHCKRPENDPQYGLAIVYLLLLLWTFLGVGIVADVFMEAIGMHNAHTPTRPRQPPCTAGAAAGNWGDHMDRLSRGLDLTTSS